MARLKINLSEVADFVPIEPGRYVIKLKKCENKPSKNSGEPTLYMKWQLLNGPNKGQNINSFASLQPQALSTFKQIALAFGAKGKGSEVFDTDTWLNRNVEAVVTLREANDNTKRMFPNISAYFPIRGQQTDDGEGSAEAVEEIATEEVAEEVVETPAPAPKKKPAAKVETAVEKLKRQLAEAEAAETSEADGEEVVVAPARPKVKTVADLKKRPTPAAVEIESEEDPF